MMTIDSFRESLTAPAPASSYSVYLQALWYDAKGDWQQAHELIQDLPDKTTAWLHAYLHRKEGDEWNANYWYTRAGKKMPALSLQQEWETIVTALL